MLTTKATNWRVGKTNLKCPSFITAQTSDQLRGCVINYRFLCSQKSFKSNGLDQFLT